MSVTPYDLEDCPFCDDLGLVEEPNTGYTADCDHMPVEAPRDTSGIPSEPFARLAAAADRILELESEVGRLQAERRALLDVAEAAEDVADALDSGGPFPARLRHDLSDALGRWREVSP